MVRAALVVWASAATDARVVGFEDTQVIREVSFMKAPVPELRIGSRFIGGAAALSVFMVSVFINVSAGDGLYNAECFAGTCAAASDRCSPVPSPCTHCTGQDVGKFCGTYVNEVCSELQGTCDCGTQYSGTCQLVGGGKKCVGLNNGQDGCDVEQCDEPTPPVP